MKIEFDKNFIEIDVNEFSEMLEDSCYLLPNRYNQYCELIIKNDSIVCHATDGFHSLRSEIKDVKTSFTASMFFYSETIKLVNRFLLDYKEKTFKIYCEENNKGLFFVLDNLAIFYLIAVNP